MLKITSFKSGSTRKHFTEYTKHIILNLPEPDGTTVPTKVGAIGKKGWGDYLEYRVYYCKEQYPIHSRGQHHPENHEQTFVLMNTFADLTLANAYVKKHFKNTETLKKEMFNVYLKLLNTLG